MRTLHENTISCYINPTQLFLMVLIILINGDLKNTKELFINKMDYIDYIFFSILGFSSFYNQTLRFYALKYDEPGKLSNYLYLTTVY